MLDIIKSSNFVKALIMLLAIIFLILVYKSFVEANSYRGYGGLIDTFNLLIGWALWLILNALTGVICCIKICKKKQVKMLWNDSVRHNELL